MYMDSGYPIIEYDDTLEAIIEPSRLFFSTSNVPLRGVVCFYQDVIDNLVKQKKIRRIFIGKKDIHKHPIGAAAARPIYVLTMESEDILVFHPGVGAPVAVAVFEEVIALGCKKFICCGSAGVLNGNIATGHIIIPTAAVRDEGISYHYLPPDREVSASAEGVAALVSILECHQLEYLLTKTWTTDAIYRETAMKVQRRLAEGCQVVEMEAASLFAVAQFRGVSLAQILYGSDNISGDDWDDRYGPFRASAREQLFWLAVEAVLNYEK